MKIINNLRKYEIIRKYETMIYLLSVVLVFSICLFLISSAKAESVTSTIPTVTNEQTTTSTTYTAISATTTIASTTTIMATSTPTYATTTTSTMLTTTTTPPTLTSTTISTPTTTITSTTTTTNTLPSATSTIITTTSSTATISPTTTATNSNQTTSSGNSPANNSTSTTSTIPSVCPDVKSCVSATTTNNIIPSEQINQAVNKILNYLKSQQDETGKIIDGGITDWSLMSFVAAGQNPADIKKQEISLLEYAKNYQFTDTSDINVCAAYPRHYLALLTAGLELNNNLMRQLITNIKTRCYSKNLYGQRGINDDIFSLIALLAAGAEPNENIIQDITKTITNDQTGDGAFTWDGWPGADITGGAVNALKYARNKGITIDETIFTKAKNYLKTQQLDDGGWGYFSSDALTTGWAIMGINSLPETQGDWQKNNKNPWYILTNTLNDNGFYESAWAPNTIDWFATKHAVPALLGQSWPIEHRFLQTQETGSGSNGSNTLNNGSTTTIATTTIATTTTAFNTSTIATTTIFTTTTIISTISTSTAENIKSDYDSSNTIQPNNDREDKKIKDNKKIIAPILTISTVNTINEQKIKETKNNATNTNKLTGEINDEQGRLSTTVEIANESLLESSGRETAKKVAATSGSGALIIGLYLGWRLLKSVV